MSEKHYISENAQLMAEWNWERNTNFDPSQLTIGSGKKVWWKCGKGHEWQAACYSRIAGNQCPICSGRKVLVGYNDLSTLAPEIALQWHPSKNSDCTPKDVTINSHRKVWWLGPCGHEWQASIADRNNERGCPYCSSKKVLKGYNDLQTVNPTLATEWNYEKNNGLKPEDVMPNSGQKVWWKCIKGHEWQATIGSRNAGRGCPCCSGRKVLKGYNDLQTINPVLATEWHYEKNNDLRPTDVTANSGQKVWWKCKKGHEWQASINSRNNGIGCPYCSGRIAIKGQTDLQTVNPVLANEWHYEKNNGLTPMDVMPNSDKKVWWKCHKGHEYKASIADRKSRRGCPYCAGKKVLKGFNDLQTVNPTLAAEWHHEKNNGLTPADVSPNSHKTVWWKCNKGHEWQAIIGNRHKGNGCPYCAGQKVLKGTNDLQTVNPILANEWNYERNNGLTPVDVSPNSNKKVWWKCSKGHEWQAIIQGRNKGTGCPYCSGRYAIKGVNDLQTVNPTLADEWNYKKNNGLTPADVMPNSDKKVWWKCKNGHEWQAMIGNRHRGNGCPICRSKSSKSNNN